MADDTVPRGWRLAKLGELGEVNRGRSRHRPRYAEHLYGGPYPFVQTGDIKASCGRITAHQQTYSEAGLAQSRLWPAGTMCITIAANIAETGILTYPACFPDSVVGFIADPSKCNVRFVEYTFRFLRRRIQHEASGSVQDNINLATLDRLFFALPPLNEQRAIADVLGSLDDKIELNRRMNRTLEQMAAAIFKAWFVDFEPVKAKAAGAKRFPSMPQPVFDALPTTFADSPLGPIPNGWEASVVGDEVKVCGGSTPSTENPAYWDGGTHAWATPKDLSKLDSPILLETERRITDAGLGCISSGLLPKGALLLSSRAPIGYLALAETPTAINQGFIAMVCDKSVSAAWMLNWCRCNADEIVGRANGTTFLEISKSSFRPMPLVVPPKPILDAFDAVVGPLYQSVAANLRLNKTLAAIRDVLLPKLMSGEMRISTTETLDTSA